MGGMGVSREIAFASLIEPALFLLIFALALPVGSTSLTALVAPNGLSAARLLAGIGLIIITIAETGRIPVDNPDTHLELTMVHAEMLLEYAGRPLGILLWATLGIYAVGVVAVCVVGILFAPTTNADAGQR